MTHTVIGFFKDSSGANDAVDELTRHGFDDSNIDISSDYGSYEDRKVRKERTGRVGNFFKSLFKDDYDAERYSQAARDNYLVTVHAFDETQAERASEILDENGAIDVNEKYPVGATDYPGNKNYHRASEASIPNIEEDRNIGKRGARRSGIRVRSRIVERPVEESLRLREEHFHLKGTLANDFGEETIEVNEYGEARVVRAVENRRKTEFDVEDTDETSDGRSGDDERLRDDERSSDIE